MPKEIEMSKSITEKELAETLREECDINRHNGWNHAARKIAEAVGIDLAPEKPEPGWYVVESGKYAGCGAQVLNGRLGVYASGLSTPAIYHEHNTWPTMRRMTPESARVVPAEPVKLSETEVGEVWDKRRIRIGNWGDLSTAKRVDITATVNEALAKHGRGRVEVSRDDVAAIIDRAMPEADLEGRMSASREIYALLEASK